MQVFKLYMKILNKHKGQIIMYIGIFAGLMFGFILPSTENNASTGFTESTVKYAIFDYDNSVISKGIGEFLEENHEKVEIKNDDKETIQDALYNQKIHCAIRIMEGYEKDNLAGNGKKSLEIYKIDGTTKSVLMEEDINSFITTINTYLGAGYDSDKAVELALEAQKVSVKVNLPDGEEATPESALHFFFRYQPWMFIAMCVCGITPVLIILDKKNVRERIECSSYKFSKMNMEIILGVLVTGFAICTVFSVASVIVFGNEMSAVQGVLYILNMFCIMAVALAIAFLVGKLTAKEQVVDLLANIISLGMAFLSGVFVPIELLSDTIIKVAHFLPAYWYELAVTDIINYKSDKLAKIAQYMGIQILFAVAIIIVGIAVSRKRMLNKSA